MRHRLPHLEVLEVLAVQIELQAGDIVRVAGALGREHEVRHLLEAIEIGQRHRRAIAEIAGAVLEGDRAGARVGQGLVDEAIDARQIGLPVVGIALVDDMAAARPFL